MLKKILLIIGTFIMSLICYAGSVVCSFSWNSDRKEAVIILIISVFIFILYGVLLFKLRKRYSSTFLTQNILLYIIFFLNGNRLLPFLLDIFIY